jgi:hypothetical protein
VNGALTAAAQLVSHAETRRPLQYETWQEEAWDFYENLGEFNYGVEWFGEALSRVRLAAAKITPGGDEPEIVDDGPVAELVTNLANGTDGQAQLLRSLGVQLSVPGDAYFVGREVTQSDYDMGYLLDAEPDAYNRVWTVQPVNTLRRRTRGIRSMLSSRQLSRWELQVDDAVWVPLPDEALICRIWDRNEHHPWRAMSPAKAALPIMREIDMYNRYIIATLVSRVAMNGMFFIPDEVMFPVNPMYEEAADPFIAELLDIMTSAIKNPGSPSAAMPVPVRIPQEYIEAFKHFQFATPLDQKIFEHREQALRRLATTLNLPAEIVTGMGAVNHWSGWQLSEDAIKIHVSPKAEIITRCLSVGYLHPMMKSLNIDTTDSDGARYIIWYDTSELTQRPDRSGAAIQLRQMLVITDEAARRETGFDEADAPTDDQLEKMVLMQLAVNPQTAVPALEELTGLKLEMPPPPVDPNRTPPTAPGAPTGAPSAAENGDKQTAGGSNRGTPQTRDNPPPAPDADVTASAQVRRDAIVQKTHSVRRRARASTARR